MKLIDLPPYAPTLMESTRAIGYSIETAIADIIDNSIAAEASQVDIDFFPIGESYISILDNGYGMSADTLIHAMQYGSKNPNEDRAASDLGRYGLGMKTASLSQCRVLTVISKQNDIVSAAQWNLNHIDEQGSWSLIVLDEKEMDQLPSIEKLYAYGSGTLVVWQDLDKFGIGEEDMVVALKRKMELVRDHLSLVFHRYLTGEQGLKKLDIRMNNLSIEPQDPFLIFGNGDADEWSEDGVSERTEGEYHSAIIPIENEEQASFFVFKHKKTLAGELYDIPSSMKEAIRYFILATAVSDYRKDNTEHRSMLVNVSRFTLVQNATADIIQSYVADLRADIENYAQIELAEAMKIKNIAGLADTWNKYGLESVSGIPWERMLRDYREHSQARLQDLLLRPCCRRRRA